MKRLNERGFFEYLFGFKEKNPSVVEESISVSEKDGMSCLISKYKPDRAYCAGRFETIEMKDLREFKGPGTGFKFNVIAGGSYNDTSDVEVGSLQAKPENCGATFQVASNFNCLEFTSAGDSASYGIGRYIFDHTQGPAASISAAPATCFRNYFIKHTPKGSNKEYVGQCAQQVNLLENYPKITMRNGYIEYRNNSPETDPYWNTFDFENNDFVKVGSHQNVDVTFGHKDNGQLDIVEQEEDKPVQRVHQVFTAAANCPRRAENEGRIAQWVVKSAYEGTIRAAIKNRQQFPDLPGSNKLFLTLVGGGVFCNPKEWIADSLMQLRPLLEESGLDVHLVVFRPGEIVGEPQQKLRELVEKTGGTEVNFKQSKRNWWD